MSEDHEKSQGVHTEEDILALARVAANNDGFEEIPPKIFQYGWCNKYNFINNANVSTEKVFDAIDQPAIPSTPDPSDSDGLGGKLCNLIKNFQKMPKI